LQIIISALQNESKVEFLNFSVFVLPCLNDSRSQAVGTAQDYEKLDFHVSCTKEHVVHHWKPEHLAIYLEELACPMSHIFDLNIAEIKHFLFNI